MNAAHSIRHGRVLLGLMASLFAGLAQALAPAGEVKMVTGFGTASSDAGVIRKLERGGPIFPGDTISTAAGSYVNIRFSDGGYVLVRPGSRFQVESFDFTPVAAAITPPPPTPTPTATPRPRVQPSATPRPSVAPVVRAPPPTPVAAERTPQRAFFRLLKGGFRAVTGAIGKLKEEDYRITTPVATIGIRGTEPFVQLVERHSPLIDQLDLPAGLQGTAGAVIGTFSGEVRLRTFARTAFSTIPTFTGERWSVARWAEGPQDDAGGGNGSGDAGGTLLGPNEFVWVDEQGGITPINPPGFAVQTPDPTSQECN